MKKILQNLRENWITYGFETLVVIVGILGAFALNNWNEGRINRSKEIAYLNQLANDLNQDIEYYKTRIQNSQRLIAIYDEKLKIIYEKQETLQEFYAVFDYSIYESLHLTIQDVTINEMKNSGHLSLIENLDLKKRIIAYYKNAEANGSHIKEFNEFSVGALQNFYYEAYNPGTVDLDLRIKEIENSDGQGYNWEFINNPSSREFRSFEDHISVYQAKNIIFVKYFEELKEKAEEIIREIDKELMAS